MIEKKSDLLQRCAYKTKGTAGPAISIVQLDLPRPAAHLQEADLAQ